MPPFFSVLRLRTMPFVSFTLTSADNSLRRRTSPFCLLSLASRHHQNPSSVSRKPQQLNKSLFKARETVRQLSSLSPALAPEDKPQLSHDQVVGLVAASQANFMRVIVQSVPTEPPGMSPINEKGDSSGYGEEKVGVELLCVVRAVLKKIKRRVLVGDKVVVGSIDWVDRRGAVENIFQRHSEILDPPVANVDHLLVLFSMDQPKLDPFTLTRFLIEAESTGIPFTLALNKIELVNEETLVLWKSRLRNWGYEPIFCSVEAKNGIDTLQFRLREQTSVIVGPSGVGKSSLINALRGNQHVPSAVEGDEWFHPLIRSSKWFEDQHVGEISARSGRGKHTTRNVSLLPLLGGGYLADTPGFNQPSLIKVTKHTLAQLFPEIRRKLEVSEPSRCAFSDCLHLGEPGCLINGDWERYTYYLQLLDEIKVREEFQLRTLGTKREGDVRYKTGNMGVMQAEPRLERKKHRRQSRKRTKQSLLDELDELDDKNDLCDEDDPILKAMNDGNQ